MKNVALEVELMVITWLIVWCPALAVCVEASLTASDGFGVWLYVWMPEYKNITAQHFGWTLPNCSDKQVAPRMEASAISVWMLHV